MFASIFHKANVFLGLLLLPATFSLAQATTPACSGPIQSVVGRITDTAKAGIPHAKVTVSCAGRTETVQTDEEGAYPLRLAPGSWQIAVDASGFEPLRQSLVIADAHATTIPDFVLAVAKSTSEVVVTAEVGLISTTATSASKSDTPLLEQPFAIQTITATQLQQQNVQTLNQALKYTAGASPEMYGPDPRGDWFLIRGNPADVYLDGLRLPQVANSPNSFAAVQVDPYDLQRFEVLEGPSSTLYGQSNIGGIVDAVSKQPTLIPHRAIQLQGGNFDRIQGGGDFSGPLNRSASWLYSINGIARSSHTFVYGAMDDRYTLNPTLTWRPTPALSLTMYGKFFHADTGTAANFLPRAGTLDANPSFGFLPTSFNTGDPVTDKYRKREYMGGYGLDYRGSSLYLHHAARFVHNNIDYSGLYSAGAFANAAKTLLYRVNFLSLPVLNGLQSDTHVRTHVRTGKLRHTLIAGTDFQWQRYLNRQGGAVDTTVTLNLLHPVYGVRHARPALSTMMNYQQFQGGLYGQEQVQFARWTLIAGGRYDATAQDTITLPLTSTATRTSVSQSPHAFTGHGGIAYHVAGLAPYASYSTSFLPTIGTDYAGKSFVPTRGSSYEAGVKYQIPGHTGMITFDAFSMTQDNRSTTDPEYPLYQKQIGQVRTVGEELQANGTLFHSLDLAFNYTHLNPVVTRSTSTDYHKQLQPLSKDTLGLWAHYTLRQKKFSGLGFGGGSRYLGPKWGDAANTFQSPGYTLFDGTADYTLDHWRIAINSTNLFDKRYVAACSTNFNCYYGGTRSAIGTVNYTF
jgi:iron complex outermembrane receptor protein